MMVGFRGTKERLEGEKGLFIGGASANRGNRWKPAYDAETTIE
jgi:hypothetical protein